MWSKDNRTEIRFDQFGWKDDDTAFLFGKNLYTANSIRPVMGSEGVQARAQFLGPTKGGSLARWSGAANQLFAAGLEPQSFALLCAFAAPLMRFHAAGEGGAIVSLVSDQSGSGKTTALEAVASVWGKLKGTQLTDEDTKVSKGLKLGLFGNLSCTYDELHNRDPEIIRQFVLMFTSGHDKDRGTIDGGLRQTKAEWQTILLLASNQSIVDILSNMEGTDAPAFRVLQFDASLPDSVDTRNGDSLRRGLAANAGYAGDAYLRVLLQPEVLGFVKEALPKFTQQIWERTKLKSEHRFWIRTIASVVVAATIVERYGILNFSVKRITDWAINHVSERSEEATVTRVRTAASTLAEFLNEHINDTLVVTEPWRAKVKLHPALEPKRQLLIRYEQHEGRAFILESHLTKWLLKRGIHKKKFFEELEGSSIVLHRCKRVTLGAGTTYASGQVTAVETDLFHPLMSGVARGIESIIPDKTRAERVAEFKKE